MATPAVEQPADKPQQILVTDPAFWDQCRTPAVERCLPGGEVTIWIHGYTFGEYEQIRRLALGFEGLKVDKEPSREALRIAQVVWCCRKTEEAGSPAYFRVDSTAQKLAFAALQEHLPGPWVETVCAESDALCMIGYVPVKSDKPGRAGQRLNLREALADRAIWTALDVLSRVICGVPLTKNDEPIGPLLSAFEASQAKQDALIDVLGALTGA